MSARRSVLRPWANTKPPGLINSSCTRIPSPYSGREIRLQGSQLGLALNLAAPVSAWALPWWYRVLFTSL